MQQLQADNALLKHDISTLESLYSETLSEIKSRAASSEEEREELEEVNKELLGRLRLSEERSHERAAEWDKERRKLLERLDLLKQQLEQQQNQSQAEAAELKDQLLHRDESLHLLQSELHKVGEQSLCAEQSYVRAAQQQEQRHAKVLSEHRHKLKLQSNSLEALSQSNSTHVVMLGSLAQKVQTLTSELAEAQKENQQLQSCLSLEKKQAEDTLHQTKLQATQEKMLWRDQLNQLEIRQHKLERASKEADRREQELLGLVRKHEEGERMRKGLREVERKEMERISRLLLVEK